MQQLLSMSFYDLKLITLYYTEVSNSDIVASGVMKQRYKMHNGSDDLRNAFLSGFMNLWQKRVQKMCIYEMVRYLFCVECKQSKTGPYDA